MTAAVAPLEDAGLITRTHDAADRRRVEVRLTEAGHAAFERHAVSADEGENALLGALTAAERRTLADLLRRPVAAAGSGATAP
ncbi:MarR family winged helix-turn-helix transcriptional regulator [Streptomyces sp. NPDC059466]|uniref:MarR family winged helix-turn-helix transcriptional regulator n=1 Tax=unclassified Streptomyces TaxID=2593676 RepID=UPI0036C6F3E1